MAEAYITVSDIKHDHIKKFNATTLQDYVDESNDWFEAYIPTIIDNDDYGVADVVLPIKPMVRNFILYYLYMRFAEDRVGSEGTATIGDNNLYTTIYSVSESSYNMIKARVTQNIILQTNVDRKTSSVNWSTIVRS